MSEHLGHSPEMHTKKLEEEPTAEHTAEHKERARSPEKEVSPEQEHKLEALAKHEAKSGKETHVENETAHHEQPIGMQRDLKIHAYHEGLRKIRSRLKPSERKLSKFIHQPVVDTVSEATGKTIVRPSGILGGGLLALLASSTVLYMGKHYGFRYNFFVFILFFGIGFGLGILVEMAVKAAKTSL